MKQLTVYMGLDRRLLSGLGRRWVDELGDEECNRFVDVIIGMPERLLYLRRCDFGRLSAKRAANLYRGCLHLCCGKS